MTIDQWGEKTAAAFLGVRLECAQCHKHPFDRWTQADYRAYANVFSTVTVGASPDAAKMYRTVNQERSKKSRERQMKGAAKGGVRLLQLSPVREVFICATADSNRCRTPRPASPLPPKALGGPEITVKTGEDPRAALFEWMRSAGQPVLRPKLRQPRLGALLRRRHRPPGR